MMEKNAQHKKKIGSKSVDQLTIQNIVLERILNHDSLYWTCMSNVEQKDGWLLFYNQQLVPRIDPNHAGGFRAENRLSAKIVQEIIDFYLSLGAVPAAFVDILASPTDLIQSLLRAGFQEWNGALSNLLVYFGPENILPTPIPVERVTSQAEKNAWSSIIDTQQDDPQEKRLLHKLYMSQISDSRMKAYLILRDGEPASRCQLFSSQGLGRIEAVLTRSKFRNQGLGSAVIREALKDSLKQNQLTYIYAEPGGKAERLYERLGFRLVAQNVIRGFLWKGK